MAVAAFWLAATVASAIEGTPDAQTDIDSTSSAVAKSSGGICNRTKAVQDAIRAGRDCSSITSSRLSSIVTLDLRGQGIKTLKAGDFAGLSSLENLYLSENDIESLPDGIFDGLHNLRSLWLEDNRLSNLKTGLFDDVPRLAILFLRRNQLAGLTKSTFRGLRRLGWLDLSQNQLTDLPADMFSELRAMTNLELGFNALQSLPPNVFRGLSDLDTLRLGSNQLTSLPPNLLEGLRKLRVLSLHSNQLETLPPNLFQDIRNMEALNIRGNPFGTLPSAVLSLTTLSQLTLAEAGLLTLPPRAFAPLTQLRALNLSGNGLQTLSSAAFAGLSNLDHLVLSDNSLKELPVGVFEGLTALRRVFLVRNQLLTLPAGFVAGLEHLEMLHLGDNPGVPFQFVAELERTDSKDLIDEGPATMVVRVAQGAPFDMSARLFASADQAALSTYSVTVPKGKTSSAPFTVRPLGDTLVRLNIRSVTPVPKDDCRTGGTAPNWCLQGIATSPGNLLILFKAPPTVVAEVADQALGAGGEPLALDLSHHFADRDSPGLSYIAETSDPAKATATIDGQWLRVVPEYGPDAVGELTVAVTAEDESGLSATMTFTVIVEPTAPRTLRGWRIGLLKQTEPDSAP